MKRLLFVLSFVCMAVLGAQAQQLKVKKFKLEPKNATASRLSRKDVNNENCALILVDVVGVGNIKFKEAVGETEYALNEYKVYVPKNTKVLSYTYGNKSGKINLDDYGIDVESLRTYRLTIETANRLRSAVFYINPSNANLVFDGKPITLDANGAVAIDKPIGKYSYAIQANGYMDRQGEVELTEDEINKIIDITMEAKTHQVALNCPVKEATLFIDNQPYGKIEELGTSLQLNEGTHSYRITCKGYEDATGEITVLNENANINASLEKKKEIVKKFRNERTKTTINMRNHMDVMGSANVFLEDDFKSYVGHLAFSFSQHLLGILTFREGVEVGAGIASSDYSRLFDKYHDDQKEKKNAVPFTVNIPLQVGVTLPLNAYNTCFISFLGGGYGAYYYTGHKSESLDRNDIDKEEVFTEIWDYGIRLNVMMYFKKLVLGFEGSRSLYKHDIGTMVGIKLGYKFAL